MLAYTTALPATTKRFLLLCIWMSSVQVSTDMAKLIEKGVNSFKFFFAYKHEGLMVRDEVGRLCSKPPCCLPGWLHTLGCAAAIMQKLWGVQCLAALCWDLSLHCSTCHVQQYPSVWAASGSRPVASCAALRVQLSASALQLMSCNGPWLQLNVTALGLMSTSLAAAVPLCAATL